MKIVIDRRITEYEWYKNKNTKILFLHALLKMNWKDKEWQGVKVKKGQFISSYSLLACETGLTVGEIRTALKTLISGNEIIHTPFTKFGLFTVVSYSDYMEE
jgi:hypothetical protein